MLPAWSDFEKEVWTAGTEQDAIKRIYECLVLLEARITALENK
tara:strand:+ start:3168 stop:3296 length:129 start_codon:yes stop_codon:yes gene_type:complete